MPTRRTAGVAAAAALLAIGLSGRSLLPGPVAELVGAPGTAVDALADDLLGSGLAVPEDWPPPLADRPAIAVGETEGAATAILLVQDDAAVAALFAELERAGFTRTDAVDSTAVFELPPDRVEVRVLAAGDHGRIPLALTLSPHP